MEKIFISFAVVVCIVYTCNISEQSLFLKQLDPLCCIRSYYHTGNNYCMNEPKILPQFFGLLYPSKYFGYTVSYYYYTYWYVGTYVYYEFMHTCI